MVSITSSTIVTPSEPTPKRRLWLSGSDQMFPWNHEPAIHIYRPQQHQNLGATIDTLIRSLSEILVPFYPLAGRLCDIRGSRFEVDCNATGAQFLVAESTKTIDDYDDFKPNGPVQELLPKVDYTKPIEETPLLMVQLTSFKGGGLSLGIATSHSIVEGFAASHFINTWAKLARGQTLEQEDIPIIDRTVLRCQQPLKPPRFDHPEFKPFPTILGASDIMAERKKETTVQFLKLTEEQVNKIKDQANQGMELPRPFSRFEAVSAYIWKCASKARQNKHNQPTTVWFLSNIRNSLNPPLPRNYFGNAVLPTVTRNVTCGEVISKPLSYTAQKIREAIGLMRKEEYVRSQLDLIESTEEMDLLRGVFTSVEHIKQRYLGNPNMRIVSWLGLPLYDDDFGWGKAVYVGSVSLNADGKVDILPSPTGDGSIIIAIRLQTAHISDFIHFLYHDLMHP